MRSGPAPSAPGDSSASRGGRAESRERHLRLVGIKPRRFMRRPAEELHDTAADPFELRNLAGDPEHAAREAVLAAELERWMAGGSRRSPRHPGGVPPEPGIGGRGPALTGTALMPTMTPEMASPPEAPRACARSR